MIGLCFIIKRNSHVLEQAFKGVFHLNGYCCLDFYCWQRKPKGVNKKKKKLWTPSYAIFGPVISK